MAGHRNSLGILRLVLATLVIFSHAFPTGGFGVDPSKAWTAGQETIGGFAVVGFFTISGYLIAKSGASADIVQFLWRRVLRIFPAFWGVLAVSALVVGPTAWVTSGRSIGAYFLPDGGPISYIRSNANLAIHQWGIHDIFVSSTPYGQQVGGSVFNGSLWTLAYEWSCYLLIAVLLVVGALKHARFVVPMLTLAMFIVAAVDLVAPGRVGAVVPELADPFTIRLTYAFLIGSTLGLYSRRVVMSDILGGLSGVIVVVTLGLGGWVLLGYPALTYFLFWLACKLPAGVQWIGAKNDYSYGMYVYGFLVQQTTAHWGWHQLGYWPWVALTIVVTAGCAWLSWHLIEKHAMALKDKGPGRGIAFWVKHYANA